MEYKLKEIKSIAPKSLYGEHLTDQEYIALHVEHISSDYKEDGYIIISNRGYIEDENIVCVLQVEKK